MDDPEVFHVTTLEGIGPAILPTKPHDRIPRSLIKIEPLDAKDLTTWAAICYETFPDVFWDMVENKETRPPLEQRVEYMAKHFKPWLSVPGFHALKAVHVETGEIMAIAGWHENGKHHVFPKKYARFPGVEFHDAYVPCCWRDDLLDELHFKEKEGWTDADVEQMYAHHSPGYFKEFESYDVGRIREMKDQPHWYLAPLCVKKKFQAKGVGMALMRYGLDRADAAVPPQPVVLEAIPSALPMYYHLGFQSTAAHGPSKDSQCVRPPVRK